MKIKVGDRVIYSSVNRKGPHYYGVVTDVAPEGVPSCREPMLKISTKNGFLLESHCLVVNEIYDETTAPSERK